jgi:hypothetical protein
MAISYVKYNCSVLPEIAPHKKENTKHGKELCEWCGNDS